MRAGARAHAPEVESQRAPAALHEGACQRLHHFVAHGAAKKRMRMGDHGQAARGLAAGLAGAGAVQQRLNGSGLALQGERLGVSVHGLAILLQKR